MQIKISISDEIYKQLKSDADLNCRTLGQEVMFIAKHHFNSPAPTPPTPPIPAPAPAPFHYDPPTPSPSLIRPPFEPIASVPTHLSSQEELAIRAEQIKEESPAPATPRKFRRPDGEPFEIADFEKYLPADTVNDDTYKTLKKKIPSLHFITILREGASRPLDDFVKYLKEEYIFTIESALGYSPLESISPQHLRDLAGYLQPHIP